MKNKFVYITFFSLVILFVFSVGSAYATLSDEELEAKEAEIAERQEEREAKQAEREANAEARVTEIEEKKAERETKKEEFAAERCEKATERLAARIEKAEKTHDKFTTYFENLQTRLDEHLSRLSEKGCDVSVSEEDIAAMEAKLAVLEASHSTYMEAMNNAEGYVCGESDGDFKDAINYAKEELALVKRNAIDLRNFVRTTLKEQLKDQVTQCKETLSNNAEDEDSSITGEE